MLIEIKSEQYASIVEAVALLSHWCLFSPLSLSPCSVRTSSSSTGTRHEEIRYKPCLIQEVECLSYTLLRLWHCLNWSWSFLFPCVSMIDTLKQMTHHCFCFSCSPQRFICWFQLNIRICSWNYSNSIYLPMTIIVPYFWQANIDCQANQSSFILILVNEFQLVILKKTT
jgi:hypothetical protein